MSYFERLPEEDKANVLQMAIGAHDALIEAGVAPTKDPEILARFREACADHYVSCLIQGDYYKAMAVADGLGLK